MVWKIRDGLNRSLKTTELRALLEENGQTVPKGESKVGDVMMMTILVELACQINVCVCVEV